MNREQVSQEILNMPNVHILCELPTSFGKSKIALDLMAKRLTPLNKILIVIPRNVLKDNWEEEFKKWGYYNYYKSAVTFVTYVSFPKKAGTWDLVIFDECHHLSERCQESLKSYNIKNSILLSATVKREFKQSLKSLFPNLGTYKVNIKDATEEGILPDPKVFLIPLHLDTRYATYEIVKNTNKGNPLTIPFSQRFQCKGIKNRKIIIKCTQQQYYNDMTSLIEWYRKKIYSNIFKQIFLRKSGERLKWLSDQKTTFVKHLLDQLHKERTLTFCNSIYQTEQLGTNCINSKNKESKNILDNFNAGLCNHITACDILNEGVNLSSCRVGIYASLNSSERIIKQKLGRLLRHPDPIIIIPYYKDTRDEELVKRMCEDYNPQLIKTINNIKEIKL